MEAEATTSLWEDYQNGLSYQASTGLSSKIPKFVKFYEGDQWAAPTPNTKNLPRPVVNFIKMICRNKKSAILSVPVKIIYRAEDESGKVDKFNRFADYISREMKQEMLDKKAIDDAVKKGSYFYHYYWDTEACGKDGVKEGGLRCEVIDPLNIFFADPTQTDEQKQEWILISSRENVRSVRAKCDRDIDRDAIVPDENDDNKYAAAEQEGSKLCTVLTRYFRKDGEVFCEKATKSVIINKAFSITPDVERAKKDLNITDAPNNALPDNHDDESLIPDTSGAKLYPIVAGSYEPREHSIYGLGEVEGLIPNQKSVNFNIAMALLNAQEMAWGKYVVAPNALRGQKITNEPGQVLTDYSGSGQGIRKMTEQPMQAQPLQIIDTLMQLTRVVTGSTEVMTGETLGAGMSGAAIAQLQSQAQQPAEELRDAFWLVKEKQGRIMAQFFKLFYAEKEFTYTDDSEAADGENAKRISDVFNSADYRDTEFDVTVEATSGTKASAAGDITALDALLAKGAISVKSYIRAYPADALTNRYELLRSVEEDEQRETEMLRSQLLEAQQQNEKLTAEIESQRATVDSVISVIRENGELKAYIANLYSEASAKIREGNRIIQMGNAKINETVSDAGDMARYIAGNMPQGVQ